MESVFKQIPDKDTQITENAHFITTNDQKVLVWGIVKYSMDTQPEPIETSQSTTGQAGLGQNFWNYVWH